MLEISISDRASKALNLAKTALVGNRMQLTRRIALNVAFLLRKQFIKNSGVPNRLGAPSTGFWKKAATSVTTQYDLESSTVIATHKGVALQYYGGEVRPQKAKRLAIPLRPEFHGKSPRDFSPKTFFVLRSKSAQRAFLCQRMSSEKGDIKLAYILTPSAIVPPAKDKFPNDLEIRQAVDKTVNFYLSEILG